jgi:hypothetical protein
MGSLQEGSGPGIEKATTRAFVLHQGSSVGGVNRQFRRRFPATGTAKAIWMKQFHQEREAFFFIHQVLNRENQHGLSFRLSVDS